MIDRSFAHKLLERFGSPLYAYDLAEAERRTATLLALLPSGSRLLYSLKANPIPDLCAAIWSSGCWIEISSSAELALALDAGCEPSGLVYSGPGKTDDGVSEALRAGVEKFSCDSWTDAVRIDAIAATMGARARAVLRVNVAGIDASQAGIGSRRGHFGVEIDGITGKPAPGLDHLDVVGIHVYFGTQIQAMEAIVRSFQLVLDLAERVADAGAFPVQVIDVGGGFPWPFAVTEPGPDLEGLGPAFAAVAEGRRRTAEAELWFESGRYVAASCGTLLATVLDVKEADKTTVVLDTGTNHLAGMAGVGRLFRPTAEPRALDADGRPDRVVDVVGPSDNPLDCLARDVTVPQLRVGDHIAISNVGAYGPTASLTGFISRPMPVEVCTRATEIQSAYRLRRGHERLG